MQEPHEWTFTDGWILMSVYLTHGDDGASLCEVIGAADAMNHAIPTSGELSRSLTRLASRGVLHEIDGKYKIVDKYLPKISKANAGKGGLFETPQRGKAWLMRTTLASNEEFTIHVADKQLADAYQLYRGLLRRK